MRKLILGIKKQLFATQKNKSLNVFKFLSFLCFMTALFFACGKDTSSYGVTNTPTTVVTTATGSLKTDTFTNNCLPSNVSGVFIAGSKLNTLNYLEVTINVKKPGNYSITTQSKNGYYFSSTGIFKDSGLNTIKLMGIGTPIAAGVNTFAVSFGGTTCTISVTVAPVIIPTAYSFDCSGTKLNGNFFADSAVNNSNNISIAVNVSSVGSYSLATDSMNGIIFRSSGTFTSKGNQSITLTAYGKPTVVGTFSYTIAKDTITCFKTVTFSHK